ncbi:hypothetical protein ACO0QE_004748 [Hanseniaspora vineae]
MLTLIKDLPAHEDKVWSLDVQRDNATGAPIFLASASTDRRIKLINLTNQKYETVETLDETVHKKSIRSVAWRPRTPQGNFVLAAGSFDTSISIWGKDTTDGYQETELLALIEGHENEVKCCGWSHTGTYLATCSRDKSIWIWEADSYSEEFECVAVLQEHSQDIKHITWHPQQLLLASCSYDDTVRIWRPYDDDWECCAVLEGHAGTVWCSSFEMLNDPETDTVRLVTCSDDSTLKIWKLVEDDFADGEDGCDEVEQAWEVETTLPPVHTRQVYSCEWNRDGRIISTGADGKLVVYKETSAHVWEIEHEYTDCHGSFEVNCCKWITNNQIATGGDDGNIRVWEILD